MNQVLISILLIVQSSTIFGQELVLPPELYWWLAEVQKGNSQITLDSFVSNGVAYTPIMKEKFDYKYLYPVFMRWNFSASRVAYFNYGCALLKDNEKYSIGWDIDSGILILDKNYRLLFSEPCGSDCGYDALAWLRDDLLVAVGININNVGYIDLIINYYKIRNTDIQLYGFECKSAFSNDVRLGLDLNWTDQRKDYFWE